MGSFSPPIRWTFFNINMYGFPQPCLGSFPSPHWISGLLSMRMKKTMVAILFRRIHLPIKWTPMSGSLRWKLHQIHKPCILWSWLSVLQFDEHSLSSIPEVTEDDIDQKRDIYRHTETERKVWFHEFSIFRQSLPRTQTLIRNCPNLHIFISHIQ